MPKTDVPCYKNYTTHSDIKHIILSTLWLLYNLDVTNNKFSEQFNYACKMTNFLQFYAFYVINFTLLARYLQMFFMYPVQMCTTCF